METKPSTVKLFVLLLSISFSFAINPFLSSSNTDLCKFLEIGNSTDYDYTNYIDITTLENNKPGPGGLIRSKWCYKGPSDLYIEVADSNTTNPQNQIFATIGGENNTQSYFELNGTDCGDLVNHAPLFSPYFLTCGYINLMRFPNGTQATAWITVEGINPVQIVCTQVLYPDDLLQYISFGTSSDVALATIYYDCPSVLAHDCYENEDEDTNIEIDLTQNQNSN